MKLKFLTVYEECKDSVYGYLLYMTKDIQLAEDLSQETFLKIFIHIGRFKGECSVKTWVLRIARNTFLTFAKKKQPDLLEEHNYKKDEVIDLRTPENIVLQMEEERKIQRILMRLNEQDRTIILLRDYEKLSYEEIAMILEMNVGVIKSRIYRARQKFKKFYYQQDDVERRN